MQADRSKDRVVISRDTRGETIGDKPRRGRVWITGPHFNLGVFSSTEDRAKASVFQRAEAEGHLASGRWRANMPQIEDA